MQAVILVGHGSLRSASGAAMIRLAARAQKAGVAPLVKAGFLNYSRPRFAETLDRVVARGATEVVVAPYFLVPGKFVRENIPQLVEQGQARYPRIPMHLADPFGDHPALAELVIKRATEATSDTSAAADDAPALLLMAHGSPDDSANAPFRVLAAGLSESGRYSAVAASFMELNKPTIPQAITELIEEGARQIVTVPFFLQLGGHVAEDLPAIIAKAQAQHPAVTITPAAYLGYDPLLVQVIADRVQYANALIGS